MASGRRSSRAPSNSCSVVSDSDSDMWSVASDDEEAFGPRLDAASLWQLLRKAHPSFRGQEEPKRQLAAVAEKLQSFVAVDGTGAESEQRHERFSDDHGRELLSWYAQRVGELEKENKALRCELIKDELGEPPPLPHFRFGRFDIAGSDDESEDSAEGLDEEDAAALAERQRHSLRCLFDVDWQRVGAANSAAIVKSLSRRGSHAATRLPSRDAEDSLEETDPGDPDGEPDGELLNAGSAASHFLALERLLVSLSEADARLIWLQFARYESEIGYLRSVISSYEDICLRGGEIPLGGKAEAHIRGLSRRRGFDLSRPRRHSYADHAAAERAAEESKPSEASTRLVAAPAEPGPAGKPSEHLRRRSTAAAWRSASTASGAGRRAHPRGSAHAILQSAGFSLLERSGISGSDLVRRGRRLSRPSLAKPGGACGDDDPFASLREMPKLQKIEAFLAAPPGKPSAQPRQKEELPRPVASGPRAPAVAIEIAGGACSSSPAAAEA